MCLCFIGAGLKLQCYVNVDLSGDIDSWKCCTKGFVCILGGTVVSSYLQKNLALSIIEVKYFIVSKTSDEIIWL